MQRSGGAPALVVHGDEGQPPCSTIYVGGMPPDATVREMAHIFRPFPGFKVPVVALTDCLERKATSDSWYL